MRMPESDDPPAPESRSIAETPSRWIRVFVAYALVFGIMLVLSLGNQCYEGGVSEGAPFPYYSHCNGPMGEPGVRHFEFGVFVLDAFLWALLLALAILALSEWRRSRARDREALAPWRP